MACFYYTYCELEPSPLGSSINLLYMADFNDRSSLGQEATLGSINFHLHTPYAISPNDEYLFPQARLCRAVLNSSFDNYPKTNQQIRSMINERHQIYWH